MLAGGFRTVCTMWGSTEEVLASKHVSQQKNYSTGFPQNVVEGWIRFIYGLMGGLLGLGGDVHTTEWLIVGLFVCRINFSSLTRQNRLFLLHFHQFPRENIHLGSWYQWMCSVWCSLVESKETVCAGWRIPIVEGVNDVSQLVTHSPATQIPLNRGNRTFSDVSDRCCKSLIFYLVAFHEEGSHNVKKIYICLVLLWMSWHDLLGALVSQPPSGLDPVNAVPSTNSRNVPVCVWDGNEPSGRRRSLGALSVWVPDQWPSLVPVTLTGPGDPHWSGPGVRISEWKIPNRGFALVRFWKCTALMLWCHHSTCIAAGHVD